MSRCVLLRRSDNFSKAVGLSLSLGFILTRCGIAQAAEEVATPLPAGVNAVWDLDLAWRQTTPTRERICLNGLWRWQPAALPTKGTLPARQWGYFKVPGSWPGITDYMQKD